MDDYFIEHIKDLKRECEEKNYVTFSSFLGLSEQSLIKKSIPNLLKEASNLYPYGQVERKILVFLPSYYSSLEEALKFSKPISLLLIQSKGQKFAEDITHRDVLGALLSLGIKRDTIGDIIIHDKNAYVYVLSTIKEEIVRSLDVIRHNKIVVKEMDSLSCPYSPTYEEKIISVSSNRLDSILSGAFSISREEAKKEIENGNVFCSEHETIKSGLSLKEGEAISLRGYGKFYYQKQIGISKKGKLRIKIKKPI